MKQISHSYIIDTSFISPLGLTTNENFNAILDNRSGVQLIANELFFPKPILASVMEEELISAFKRKYNTNTRFDSLLLACLDDIKNKGAVDFSHADTLIILSTTKGNVELLEQNTEHLQAHLSYSAQLMQNYLKNPNKVLIVSNACISGVSACLVAKRYLDAAQYKHVLVVGCDAITRFVLSGFSSFKAISKNGCRPFDIHRDGVVLGEACGAILLSSQIPSDISIVQGFISNDANHISGPSKTGEELAYCIHETLENAQVASDEIDFIAAHGTATLYNDEMESKAIDSAGLRATPLYSVKAHLGHTLGASGVIETIIAVACMKNNMIIPSKGFEEKGVSADVHVNQILLQKEIRYALKTTSGFGGCNAAMLLMKNI